MKDLVCRMAVDSDSEFRSKYNGKTYYFCCIEDKRAFDKDPKRYVK